MKGKDFIAILCVLFFFTGCEEIIDVDLNDAAPRIVIEANLSDLTSIQRIRVSQTVAFDEVVNSAPLPSAEVIVVDNAGNAYYFYYERDGNYLNDDFTPVSGRTYLLQVDVDGEIFQSSCFMPPYVEVDSTGIIRENILGDEYYFATFKFNDPEGEPNYYRYDVQVNDGPYRFSTVFQDKFNDGLYVTHQVSDLDADMEPGDYLTVRRYCIDEKVFKYWDEYQSTNPGSAAPANPTSNILNKDNNALGYFSVASAREFNMHIADFDFDWDDIDGQMKSEK